MAAGGDDESEMFDAIRRVAYAWPPKLPHDRQVSAEARDIVRQLLMDALPPPTGCLPRGGVRLASGPDGALELRRAAWFGGFDWVALETRCMPPPFVPQLASAEDDSNFGPMEWRGEPILHAPQHDASTWNSLFDDW